MRPDNYYALVLAHGVVMSLALLWFIPLAIFAAKFLRPSTRSLKQQKSSQLWKYIHITMNVMATMLIIAGFTLGYYASGNSFQVGTMNAHFVCNSHLIRAVIDSLDYWPHVLYRYSAASSRRTDHAYHQQSKAV